jgi:dipeptidyl aminopeptidase/acylaminoacyl peptidase
MRYVMKCAVLLCVFGSAGVFAQAPEVKGYLLPSAPLQAIVEAPRQPQFLLSPKRDKAALIKLPNLPSISTVAQPELKLAGLRINPRTYSQSRFSFGTDIYFLNVANQSEIKLQGLPENLRVADAQWSPDQSLLAFTHVKQEAGEVELWLVDVASAKARKLSRSPLNSVTGRGFAWLPNSQSLLVNLRVMENASAPVSDGIPSGPAIQESMGGAVRQLRTFPDLLKSESDAKLFEHYAVSQLAVLGLNGETQMLGKPDWFTNASVSPDGKYILSTRLARPFSFIVPANSFPKRIEVRDMRGEVVHNVAQIPLIEGLPVGNDAVPQGVRSAAWRADAPASIMWAQALDEGDPAKAAEFRDEVFIHAAPFKDAPRSLAKFKYRFAGAVWGNSDTAIFYEYWWKTRQIAMWKLAPDKNAVGEILFSGSSEDRYNDPGNPLTRLDDKGYARLQFSSDGSSIFMSGEGASAEGDRPFVDRWNLQTKQKQRLFHSAAPFYESPVAMLDDDGKRIITTRESPTEPPNFYIRNTANAKAGLVALTKFPHPTPQLKAIKKEQIRYKRADGVDLTANLYLPPNYNPKRDGRLPFVLWAYPTEFKSADAASQVTGSPHIFNAVSYWGPQAFLALGYGVLDDPSMPIIGEGDKEPNDTYLPQLIASAEAAINELERRGVGDRNRMAIGGHSYGAFMTANLLAHTRLFKAGIARSGAYNRTLTPFGFQSEERNFWKAKDVYQSMSPFNYAENIKDPLLIIHGEQDNNSGTFPIQSERLFAAIKGLGGPARLVMLPNESHGYRARESILHMLAESEMWLNVHVKKSAPAAASTRPSK